jgi:checkpoint serine/threonine-protein kinase
MWTEKEEEEEEEEEKDEEAKRARKRRGRGSEEGEEAKRARRRTCGSMRTPEIKSSPPPQKLLVLRHFARDEVSAQITCATTVAQQPEAGTLTTKYQERPWRAFINSRQTTRRRTEIPDKMSVSEDLIDFEIIENQKENIQSLPGGRSARALASMFSPSPLHKLMTPTPSDTKDLNDAIRQKYEAEILNISESDDPLDIYDRYVRWTLNAYPSAQATPASQLLPLLERATKAFLISAQYKNDPRYLKMWIQYIRFFSDTPRETFAFLARHNIGEGLALFYEEFAAWLEAAGRWTQAEEVYKMGIEKEARPAPRLLRKFSEFQQRFSQRPEDNNEPSSPALPTVRPALAAKIDPYAAAAPRDPQAPRPNSGVGGSVTKSGRQKLTIFSDADNAAPAVAAGHDTKGWESIGSLAERKKENMMEPKPWVGETLKAGGKKSSTKIAVFKDEVCYIFLIPLSCNY